VGSEMCIRDSHNLLVRVLTGIGVLNGFDDFDVVATRSGVSRTLARTGVLRYFSHDAIVLFILSNRFGAG